MTWAKVRSLTSMSSRTDFGVAPNQIPHRKENEKFSDTNQQQLNSCLWERMFYFSFWKILFLSLLLPVGKRWKDVQWNEPKKRGKDLRNFFFKKKQFFFYMFRSLYGTINKEKEEQKRTEKKSEIAKENQKLFLMEIFATTSIHHSSRNLKK